MPATSNFAAVVTCVAVIGGAAILWRVYKEKATERKLAEEVRVIRVRAEKGEADAQYRLGLSYCYGQGVPQDYTEAVRWFRKAAEHGYAKAQYSLGSSYYYGGGVPHDYTEAIRLYRKAADQGDAMAQYGLGFMYYKGKGVPQDYAEAVRWYRKAAGQGDVDAQYALSEMYRDGEGVPRNYAQAVRWFGKVAASSLARCFARQGGPAARWTSIVVILLGLLIVAVPQPRWGRGAWLSWALTSVLCAVALAHELLLSPSFAARLARGSPWTIHSGFVRLLFLVLLAGGSVIFAAGAVQVAVRGSKSGGDRANHRR